MNNLLSWANQNLKSASLSPENLNLSNLVEESVVEQQLNATKKQIALKKDISPELEVFTDKQALLTITRNILANAIKFTPPRGEVILSARQKNGTVLFDIKDSGVGIPAHRLPNLFDLQKNKSTDGTEGEKGTGLGLTVSKELALLNGGDILVESVEGKGSTFTIKVPAS